MDDKARSMESNFCKAGACANRHVGKIEKTLQSKALKTNFTSVFMYKVLKMSNLFPYRGNNKSNASILECTWSFS